jgi:ABC-type cobalamin/Fe3+-siderophores transport system ATPase subunit
MTLTIPELSLVVLIGPSGCGKSTFARRHFKTTEVLSSDSFRALVSDEENDQSSTDDAFAALHFVAARRLARAKLTVVDAPTVQRASPTRSVGDWCLRESRRALCQFRAAGSRRRRRHPGAAGNRLGIARVSFRRRLCTRAPLAPRRSRPPRDHVCAVCLGSLGPRGPDGSRSIGEPFIRGRSMCPCLRPQWSSR